MIRLSIIILSCFLSFYGLCHAQFDVNVEEYVQEYRALAVEEMKEWGIPASIKLAQGILETNAGQSRLAKQANNHFGIKCKRHWQGATIYHDDDQLQECFRAYSSSHHSYRDHSQFLQKKRYRKLFELASTDYKGWARELKRAGYATNPRYAHKLIELIERYRLYEYDNPNLSLESYIATSSSFIEPTQSHSIETELAVLNRAVIPELSNIARNIFKGDIETTDLLNEQRFELRHPLEPRNVSLSKCNKCRTVVCQEPVTPDRIAYRYRLSMEEMIRINGYDYYQVIPANSIIYLEPKQNKASRKHKKHELKEDECMEDVARMYGVNKNSLLKLNLLKLGQEPLAGETIYLRRKARKAPKLKPEVRLNLSTNKRALSSVEKGYKETEMGHKQNEFAPPMQSNKKLAIKYYYIQPGDTLTKIAQQFDTTVGELFTLNSLQNDHIKFGTLLRVK